MASKYNSIPARLQAHAFAEQQINTAQLTLQNTIASNIVSYGLPGFVTPANFAAYDAATVTAYATRQTSIAAAFALTEA